MDDRPVETLDAGAQHQLSGIIQRLYKLTDLDAFIVTAMAELPKLINADVGAYNEVNYQKRRMLTLINDADFQRWYDRRGHALFEPLMHQNPLIEHNAKIRDRPQRISDFISLKEWRSRDLYQVFYKPHYGSHQIAVVLPLETSKIVAFAFNREASDFTDLEKLMLTELQPHLTQAYQNAEKFTHTKNRLNRREAMLDTLDVGWVDLDERLYISDITAAARDMIEQHAGIQLRKGDRLPGDLDDWVRAHSVDDAPTASPFTLKTDSARLTFRLYVSPEHEEFSILVDRYFESLSVKSIERLGLTKRQAEILYWISQGKSNAEIAIILSISIRTVENHVSSVLSALGVSNRTEAVSLVARRFSS